MTFLREKDFKEIQAWLKANAIKDSEIIENSDAADTDTVIVCHTNNGVSENYKVSIKNLLKCIEADVKDIVPWVVDMRQYLRAIGDGSVVLGHGNDGAILIGENGIRIQGNKPIVIGGTNWADYKQQVANDIEEAKKSGSEVVVKKESANYSSISALVNSGKNVVLEDEGSYFMLANFNEHQALFVRNCINYFDGIIYYADGTEQRVLNKIGDFMNLKTQSANIVNAVNEVYDYTHEQQKQFHVLIDYNGSLAPIEIRGNRAEVVCRYTANPYEGAAPTTIFKPACRCTVDGETLEEYSVKMYNQASMSEESRIYPSMDGTVEIAQGVTIWVKFSVKLDYRVLGQTLSFAAGCAFSNFEAAPMTKREKVLAYVDEEAVDFVHGDGKIHLHTQSAGKPLGVHGKKFASDFRYALKVEAEGMPTGSDYGIVVLASPRADIEFTITKREVISEDALVVSYNNYTFEVPLA